MPYPTSAGRRNQKNGARCRSGRAGAGGIAAVVGESGASEDGVRSTGPRPFPVVRSSAGLTAIAEALCRWGCGTRGRYDAGLHRLGELLRGQAAGPQTALLGLGHVDGGVRFWQVVPDGDVLAARLHGLLTNWIARFGDLLVYWQGDQVGDHLLRLQRRQPVDELGRRLLRFGSRESADRVEQLHPGIGRVLAL